MFSDMASLRMVQLFKKLIAPKSKNKDIARREYILNILLVGAIALSSVAFLDNLINHLHGTATTSALSIGVVFSFVILFCLLLYLSKKGKIIFSAVVLICLFYFPAIYSSYTWGALLPVGLMLYAVVIVITGILISSIAGFFITFITTVYLLILTYLQVNNITPPIYWQMQNVDIGDTFVIVFALIIISAIAWLYNREMEQALNRARISENDLREERDNLETIVEERTKALRIAQMEKISQLERFAEVGRISSGLIHDLATPLSLVSLNLEKMNKLGAGVKKEHFIGSNVLLKRATIGIKRLESFVQSARKQVQYHEMKETFSLKKEMSQILQLISYTAKEKKVKINLHLEKDIRSFGNVAKFNQVITNLLINAVDAYEDSPQEKKREIMVSVKTKNKKIEIKIKDFGVGINQSDLLLIFQPFFTTKQLRNGMGIGLSLCKEIIEKDFKGKISVESTLKEGTVFTLLFPVVRQKEITTKK